jgi:addiction module HigA family antidote
VVTEKEAIASELISNGAYVSSFKMERLMKSKSLTITKLTKNRLAPVSPGEMLLEEFLKPLGISQYRLAKEIGVPAQRISAIVAGKRTITADTDLRLCKYFGLSDGWWLRVQAHHDTELAKVQLKNVLNKIMLCPELLAA